MIIYLDKKVIRNKMEENGIKTISELSRLAGVNSPRALGAAINNSRTSPKISYLLADFFGCHVEELWTVDWARDRVERKGGERNA